MNKKLRLVWTLDMFVSDSVQKVVFFDFVF